MPRCPYFTIVSHWVCCLSDKKVNSLPSIIVPRNCPLTLTTLPTKACTQDLPWCFKNRFLSYFRVELPASHAVGWASRSPAVQLGLIYAADRAVSLQHRALWGTFGKTAFQFILWCQTFPTIHFRVLKQSRGIDQHLKLGPTSCPAQRIWWPSLSPWRRFIPASLPSPPQQC